MYERLILSGGGTSILSFVYVLKILWSHYNEEIPFKSYYGTSAGSIISFLLCIGFSPKGIIRILEGFDYEDVIKFEPDDLLHAIENNGIISMNKLRQLLNIVCNIVFVNEDVNVITFKYLYEKTGKDLYIFATNITKQEQIIFSHKTHPDMNIIDAILMSCSIPLIFEQQRLILENGNTDIIVDGCVTSHLPINILTEDELSSDKTLGIVLKPKKLDINITQENPLWLLYSSLLCIYMQFRSSVDYLISQCKFHMIVIETSFINIKQNKEDLKRNAINATNTFLLKHNMININKNINNE
jgi:predicted acylesterase/phospholipase RssA